MSVRRRARRERVERVERDARLRESCDKLKRQLTAILDMCQRKIAAGETSITAEELQACFTPQSEP